jgi:hypothetical protein
LSFFGIDKEKPSDYYFQSYLKFTSLSPTVYQSKSNLSGSTGRLLESAQQAEFERYLEREKQLQKYRRSLSQEQPVTFLPGPETVHEKFISWEVLRPVSPARVEGIANKPFKVAEISFIQRSL